ncbi:hypothetical protein [Chromobacterium amazonense]|uniref:hypothetical protein n=1 Tax=Chromobacterium amazonense TaxID=1382803 RepID=UPI003D116104
MPKDTLQSTVERMSIKPVSQLARQWQAADDLAGRVRRHLRPLFMTLNFSSIKPDSPWLSALAWVNGIFAIAHFPALLL